MQITDASGTGRMEFFPLRRKAHKTTLAIFLGLIFISQSLAFRQPEDSARKKMLETKGYSQEQKAKMKEIRTQHKKEVLAFQNQIREKEARLQTLESADKADLNAIYQVIDEIQSLKGKLMKSNAAHKQEIRKLLTPEQRLEFDLKSGKRHKGHHSKGHKMDHKGHHEPG